MTGQLLLNPESNTREVVRMCCHCRRVKDELGEWVPAAAPADRAISHGICPDCFVVHYPEFAAAISRTDRW